ncbi:OsmC family protein [Streptomyces sp. NPDC054796]
MSRTAPGTGAPPERSSHQPAPGTGQFEVRFTHGETYAAHVGGHEIVVDQPTEAGGDGNGPTPVELFVVSLASCVAFYAGGFLTRIGVRREGLRVTADFAMATDRPTRVARIGLTLTVPARLTEQQRRRLLAVVNHCTVGSSLRQPPRVEIRLR